MQHITQQQQQLQQQQHDNMYAYATPPVTGFGFPHVQTNQIQQQQQQQQQQQWQSSQQQYQPLQSSSFHSHLPVWKQHPHIPSLQPTFSPNPHAPAAPSMWRCKRPRDGADCLDEPTPAELPPPCKRMHTQSDDSTLVVDSRRASGELGASGIANGAVDSDTSAATVQSSSSAMEDLCSPSPPCTTPPDDVVCASPLSDEEPTRSGGDTASAEGAAPQSPSADIEIDTDQWRRLQVNDEFAPLLNQMKSEQARNAAGFGSGASTRAVWDRYAPNPRHESALAHASVLSIVPPSQSLVLYKPSRSPAAICQIDSDSEGSLSPNTIAVFTPAAAAAAAAAASSSTAQPCPPAVCMAMRPGSLPHAGWKRRRLSDDAELPLYTPTCTVEELSDCDEQSTKRPRRRSSTTPISPAPGTPGTPGSQCMQDSQPPSPIHMATAQLDDAVSASGALSMLPPSSAAAAAAAAHSAGLCSSSFPSRLSGPQTWPSTMHSHEQQQQQQQQVQQGPLSHTANGFAPSQWQSSNAAASFPLPSNAAHMTSW